MRLAIVMLALAGCSGDEKPQPRRTVETTEEKAPKAEEAEAPKGPTGAKALAAAEKHEEAIPEIEKLLAENPTEDGLFTLLRLEALAGGKAGEVLDRLDANAAIGDRVREHFRLRAELALAAGRPSDAMAAARRIAQANPEEGAAYIVRAVRAGAAAPAPDPANPSDAFITAALMDAKKAAPALAAMQLSSWQARALRAEVLQESGDHAAAIAELDAVLSSGDADAQISLAPRFAELSPDQALAGRHLAAAAKAADALSAGADATRLTSLAVDHLLRGGQVDAAVELATGVLASRQAVQDTRGGAEVSLRLAQAHISQGAVAKALEESTSSSTTAKEASLSTLAAEAAWTQGVTAAMLGEVAAVADAAGRAEGPRAAVLQAVRGALVADAKADLTPLTTFEADEGIGLRLHMVLARLGVSNAKDHLARAARLADALGDTSARIEARLEMERLLRENGDSSDAVMKEILAIADGLGSAAAPLRAEIAARRSLVGQVTQGGLSADLGDAIKQWGPIVAHDDILKLREAGLITDDPNALPDNPLARIAVGRAYLRAKQPENAYAALHAGLSALPSYNQGPWAPASVLYGGAGVGVEQDLIALHGMDSPAAALVALTLQEWLRGTGSMRDAFLIGDDPSLSLPPADRLAYNDAHLKLRADTLAWLSGKGPAPDASAAALDELTKKAMENLGFARSLPAPLADYKALPAELQGTAIMSYRLGGSLGEAVILTGDKGRVVALKDTKKIRASAQELSRALRAGAASGGSPVSPKPGDAVRRQLVDIFAKELVGVGRYLVIPDGPLREFSFSVLPEQQEGLRFLADIRSISMASSIAELRRPNPNRTDKFSPDYLGLSAGAVASNSPDELRLASEVENVGRLFTPEGRVILSGKDATWAAFKEKAPTSRFLHLMNVTPGERGAMVIGADPFPLADIRSLKLSGKIVILSGKASTEVMARWVQALQSAGVESVVYTAWTVEPGVQASYFHRFFDAIIQERTAARAMSDSRQSMQADSEDGGDNSHFDPSWWGQFILNGMP